MKRALAFALALTAAATLRAATYYWIGEAGADHATVSNWGEVTSETGDGVKTLTLDSEHSVTVKATTAASIAASDTRIFTYDTYLPVKKFDAQKLVITNAARVVIGQGSDKNNRYLAATARNSTWEGNGTIVVSNAFLRATGSLTVSCAVEPHASNTDGGFLPNEGVSISFTGALTGSGTLICTDNKASNRANGGVEFKGDLSAFTGTVKVYGTNYSPYSRFSYRDGTSGEGANVAAKSRWEFCYTNQDKLSSVFPFRMDDTVYEFGSLKAVLPEIANETRTGITLKLGEQVNEDSYLGGTWANVTGGGKVIWAASSATLTNECANTASIEVTNGGTVAFPSEAGLPETLTFTNGGTVIADYSESIAAKLAAYNLGENVTVKYTTMTLTLPANAKKGDTLVSVEGVDFSETKITLLSAATGEASRFFKASASDGAVTVDYADDVYIWTGDKNTAFNDAGNWVKPDGTAMSAYNGTSKYIVEKEATFAVGSNSHDLRSVYFGADVTFKGSSTANSGSSLQIYQGHVWEGPGKVKYDTLWRIRTVAANSPALRIYNDVEFSNVANIMLRTDVEFHGAASGDAAITLTSEGTSNLGGTITFYGDMRDFTGSLTTEWLSGSKQSLVFGAPTTVGGTIAVSGSNGNSAALCADAGTYEFASLSGKVNGGAAAVKIVTKATEATDIAYTAGAGAWTLENAGSATVTVTGANFSGYTMSGTGAFTLPTLSGASVTKVGTAANAKCPALVAGENADLTGLSLALTVDDADVKGWQYLVEATSFSAGDPATAYASSVTLPTGRKFVLTMASSSILAAQEPTGLLIIVR